MFSPVTMCKVNVLVLHKFVTPLTQVLGDLGLIHLVNAVEQSEQHLLAGVDCEQDLHRLRRRLERCSTLAQILGVELRPKAAMEGELSLEEAEVDRLLDEIEAAQKKENDALNDVLQKSGLLVKTADQLRLFPSQATSFDTLRDLNHLHLVAGRLSPSLLPDLTGSLADRAIVLNDPADSVRRGQVLVLTSRRNRWAVESELGKLGFVGEAIPEDRHGSPEQERGEIESRLKELQTEIEQHRLAILRLADRYGGMIEGLWRQVRQQIMLVEAQKQFGQSRHLYCISGWVPAAKVPALREVVERVTSGTAVVEEIAPDEDERVQHGLENVPVQFVPSPVLRPFQTLIANFGAPRYGELDPSLFVALSFVIMFGIMFGDIGQGALVVLLGYWLRRTRHPGFKTFSDAGILLMACGVCAMIFGCFYGSIFGYENPEVLRPVWLSPIHDVTRLLIAAIAVGILWISMAIVINIINKVRSKHYFEGIFHRFGVLGIIFYWGSLGIGLKAARAGQLDTRHAVILIAVPLILLFIREPLHNLLHHKGLFHGGAINMLVESCVETMETVTAFLGGTVSFVRMGVMALSHACLCYVTYVIADILNGLVLGSLWSFLAIVTGNLVVICLEGMIVMIQGVRLEYYELFSKYYAGDGVLYAPFRLSDPNEIETVKGES